MKKVLWIVMGVVAIATTYSAGKLRGKEIAMINGVQSGELTLVCELQDGQRHIDGEKVKDFIDGRWYFENGSATNCSIY